MGDGVGGNTYRKKELQIQWLKLSLALISTKTRKIGPTISPWVGQSHPQFAIKYDKNKIV